MKMKAMILAAGLGTRLRPITEKFAKPAVPFLNIPLLYYPLYLMEQTGCVDGLVLNTHHLPEQIEGLAARLPDFQFNFDIAFSNEMGTPLGSGGGIWKARPLLEGAGNFLVANGDEVILPQDPTIMKSFVEKHEKSGALCTILVMKHPLVGTQFGGVWADSQGRVLGFGKDASKFAAGTTGYHYIGILLLNDRIFKYLPEGESNIFYDVMVKAIAAGEKVEVHAGSFTWFETGNPTDFLKATEEALSLLASGKGEDASALKKISQRFWKNDSRFIEKAGTRMVVAKSAKVSINAKLGGFVVIGENASVGKAAQIDDAVLLPESSAADASTLRNEIKI
jgi:mannose-1-phosphate guanylyltransferase